MNTLMVGFKGKDSLITNIIDRFTTMAKSNVDRVLNIDILNSIDWGESVKIAMSLSNINSIAGGRVDIIDSIIPETITIVDTSGESSYMTPDDLQSNIEDGQVISYIMIGNPFDDSHEYDLILYCDVIISIDVYIIEPEDDVTEIISSGNNKLSEYGLMKIRTDSFRLNMPNNNFGLCSDDAVAIFNYTLFRK